jgi:segregation and condensation protein B
VLELARAEIEAIRGAALARGTLDRQLEAAGCGRRDGAWLRGGRSIGRRPRRFSRISVSTACADLPGINELRAAGLLDIGPASLGEPVALAAEHGEAGQPEQEGGNI